MKFKELNIQNFRIIKDGVINFDPKLTTLVGENGAGKSTTCLALSRILSCVTSSLSDPITQADYPFGIAGPLSITLTLELEATELHDYLIAPLISTSDGYRTAEIRHGGLSFSANHICLGPEKSDQEYTWRQVAQRIVAGTIGDGQHKGMLTSWIVLDEAPGAGAMNTLGEYLRGRFRIAPEFRMRTQGSGATGAVESWAGSELTGALYNLSNHPERRQRDRFTAIKRSFETVFPRYEIEAVQEQQGSNNPQILFYVYGQNSPLTLKDISAGEHEILTFLTNLVSQTNLVVFIEHPEGALHPHGMRFLQETLTDASADNQIITTTHSPMFVNPESPDALRRFWRTGDGVKVRALESSKMTGRKRQQIHTALRRLDRGEVVFARSVVLVEEETTVEFLFGVAAKLGFGLNADGVSIVTVEGGNGFGPYHTLLESLGIPHVNLRDDSWGNNPAYPPNRFFSLGVSRASFEAFMDAEGLAELRQRIIKQIGNSKPRVAAEMARRLSPGEIPTIFREVLQTAVTLAVESPVLYLEGAAATS